MECDGGSRGEGVLRDDSPGGAFRSLFPLVVGLLLCVPASLTAERLAAIEVRIAAEFLRFSAGRCQRNFRQRRM